MPSFWRTPLWWSRPRDSTRWRHLTAHNCRQCRQDMTVVVTCGQMRTHGFNDTESSFNSSLHQTHIQRTVVVTGSDTYSALFETIKGPRRIVQTQELPHGQAGGDKEQTKGARLYSCSRVDRTSGARDGMCLARTGKGGGVTLRTSWQCPCVRWDFARRPAVPAAGPPGSRCRSCLWTSAWAAARDGSLETCLSAATHTHTAKMGTHNK